MNNLDFELDRPIPDRFVAYRELYAVGAEVEMIGPRFDARLRAHQLDRSLIYDRRLRDVAHGRDARHVRRAGMEHFTLTLLVSGELHIDDGSGFRRLAPGEIMLLDMTRPTRNRAPDAHIVTLSVARDRIEALTPEPRRLHGQIIPAGAGVLLAEHLGSLARHGGGLTPVTAIPATRAGMELLAAVLGGEGPRGPTAREIAAERVDRVRAFIEARLCDPAMDVEVIIEQFALSRATLYRDFQRWGGLASYIRMRRIELARERLADRGDARSLAELAATLGFSTEARLSETFLAAFGMRPGAYRRAAQLEEPVARAVRTMKAWQRVLR
ncbi:MAG: helix-turn-helix domain-containing protein [Sphingomonas sp.]